MKNFSLERTLLLLGDKSRFIFAKKFTGALPPDYENFSLLLEHGEPAAQIQRREEFFRIESFRTPPGIKFMLLKFDDESWREQYKNFSRLIIFEEFPLKKDSTQQLIEAWRNLPRNRPPLSIVIMDLIHRQGSTDLDRLDDAIIEAKKDYEAQGLDVIFFRSDADAVNIFYRHESLIQKHKKVLSHELEEIYNRKNYELDFLYEDFLFDCEDAGGCLSLSAISKICSFESVKSGNKNSIWEAYNEAAIKKLFPSDVFAKGNLNELVKIYGYILTGDFEGQDLTSDKTNLRVRKAKLELTQTLQRKFLSRMVVGKFSAYVSPYEVRDAVSYKKLTSDRNGKFYGINAEYGRQLRRFVEKTSKEILLVALEDYIQCFERVIS